MKKIDIKVVNFPELVEFLKETEKRNGRRVVSENKEIKIFSLNETEDPSFSNMDFISEWASLHGYSIYLAYSSVEKCLIIKLNKA